MCRGVEDPMLWLAFRKLQMVLLCHRGAFEGPHWVLFFVKWHFPACSLHASWHRWITIGVPSLHNSACCWHWCEHEDSKEWRTLFHGGAAVGGFANDAWLVINLDVQVKHLLILKGKGGKGKTPWEIAGEWIQPWGLYWVQLNIFFSLWISKMLEAPEVVGE